MKFRRVFVPPSHAMVIPALTVLWLLLLSTTALAQSTVPGPGDVAPQPDGPVLTGINVYLTLLSLAATGVGYVVNHYAPWVSEQAKGIFMILFNAAVACVYQLISAGNFGWNEQTLVAVLQAVVVAGLGHIAILKPTGIAAALGAGTNSNGEPQVDRLLVRTRAAA